MALNEKRSFEDFIKIMSERNNYNYDYSLVSKDDYYKYGSDRLIPILCNVHGKVMVNQAKHSSIKGSKCPDCIKDQKENKSDSLYQIAKLKQESNIEILKTTIYGFTNLYTIYLDNNLSIHIDCLTHGNIRKIHRHQSCIDLTTASLKCPECKTIETNKEQSLLKEEAKQRPSRIFKERLISMCESEPLNEFAQLIETVSKLNRDTSRYDYSYNYEEINKLFRNYKIPYSIPVICNKHGKYKSVMKQHILGKSNCPICAGTARISKEDCLARFNQAHGEKFDYSKFKFISMGKKSIIRCIEHNHWFKSNPSNHINCSSSGGCKECQTSGFNPSKPGALYYLSINNGEAYKIGITNFDVNRRFIKDKTFTYKIISVWTYENGQKAFDKELEIKRKYKDSQYKGDPLMKSGNTELFTHDILGLDT